MPSESFPPSHQSEAVEARTIDGFHNPEVERIPTPRTTAARALTQLAHILIPSAVQIDTLDTQHTIDTIDFAVTERIKPPTPAERSAHMEQIKPLLIAFEATGIGDYRTRPDLKNIHHFSTTATGPTYTGLLMPWQYHTDGTILPTIDISKLTMAVQALPDTTPEEMGQKTAAEDYLHTVVTTLQTEEGLGLDAFIDRLDAPDREHLNLLRSTLDAQDEAVIARIAEQTTFEKDEIDPERVALQAALSPLLTLIRSMHQNSSILADTDRTRFPEFWYLVDQYHRYSCALGIKNMDGTIRHTGITYPP